MGLASSVNFLGKTIEECLRVLHTDIVRLWNIQADCGVYLLISSPLLTLMEIVLLVSGKRGAEKLLIELVRNQYDDPSDPNTIL